MIQKSFTRAIENVSNIPTREIWHTYHCAELLRQAIKCAADPTLDTTFHRSGKSTEPVTTGWNGTHICRDYGSLFAWTEEHRINEQTGLMDERFDEHQG